MKTLKDLIKLSELGSSNENNENIEKLFKTEKIRGEVEIKNFGRMVASEEVIAELKKDGCLPANATELFHWVSQNKNYFKGEYETVVALGSVADPESTRRVPIVWWGESERRAGLSWFVHDWDDNFRFAFIRTLNSLLT